MTDGMDYDEIYEVAAMFQEAAERIRLAIVTLEKMVELIRKTAFIGLPGLAIAEKVLGNVSPRLMRVEAYLYEFSETLLQEIEINQNAEERSFNRYNGLEERHRSKDEIAKPSIEEDKDIVLFTCFFPSQCHQVEHTLLVYIHIVDALMDVISDAQQHSTDNLSQASTNQMSHIAEGTTIEVIPTADELEFDTVSLAKKWRAPWRRFEFSFLPLDSALGKVVSARVSILVETIEIASIDLEIDVAAVRYSQSAQDRGSNPLHKAKLKKKSSSIYQKIFVSYSRKDTQVVEAYKAAQEAVGNEVFVDTYSIRSGEDWQARLAEAIDNADIFQLFWSENSAMSEAVRVEWDYALTYRCPDTECRQFIRPVFWKQPLNPNPPQPLKHLNFKYAPLDRSSIDPRQE